MEHITYLTARQVRERYQISAMSLWRWLRDDALGFPKPTVIRNRRYFEVRALDAWDLRQREVTVDD